MPDLGPGRMSMGEYCGKPETVKWRPEIELKPMVKEKMKGEKRGREVRRNGDKR